MCFLKGVDLEGENVATLEIPGHIHQHSKPSHLARTAVSEITVRDGVGLVVMVTGTKDIRDVAGGSQSLEHAAVQSAS